MSNYGSSNVGFFLVGGYSLLGNTTELNGPNPEALFERSDTLGDSWEESTPVGVQKADFNAKGFYDDAAAAINEAVVGLQNVSRVTCIGHEGNTVGKHFIGAEGAYAGKYHRIIQRGALHKANVDYQVSGAVEQGVILQDFEAITADGNTDAESVDNTALTSNGGSGYLQVGAFTGFTGYVAKIRHSADDSTYADLITFTNVTAARQAERKTVTGTVNRHLLVAHDVTGSGSAEVMCGFARA